MRRITHLHGPAHFTIPLKNNKWLWSCFGGTLENTFMKVSP